MDNTAAIANLPSDMAILKLENDTITAMAAARPRNHESIKRDLLEQVAAYPSFARNAIYSKPVGKDQSGRQQYARGLSIRAAEAIAEAYGFNRVRCDVLPLDADRVKVEATFTDYQRGRIWQSGAIVSKVYRGRGGQAQRHSDDRFYGVVVKAECSRQIREVILRSVPPGLRSELEEAIERQIEGLLDEATSQKIVAQFAGKGVTAEQLETHVGRTIKAGWTQQDRLDMLGLWNAIKTGETTVDEIFGADAKPDGAKTDRLAKEMAGANGATAPQPAPTAASREF